MAQVNTGGNYAIPKAPSFAPGNALPGQMSNVGGDLMPGVSAQNSAQAIASQNNQGQAYQAQLGLRGQMYGADASKAASEYGADQGLAGTRYTTDASTNQFNQRLQFARDRYNQLFPYISSQLNGGGSSSSSASGAAGGGTAPEITTGGVYSPQQIQEQVNSVQSGNDRSGATAYRKAQSDLGGRGFGNNSPLLAQIQSNLAIGTQAANANAAQSLPFQAAQANSDQRLKSQVANSEQYSQRQQEGIQRQSNQITQNNALLQALTQLANFNV